MTIYSTDGGRYYEGRLQLRPFNEEVYEWIKKQIDKDDFQFISREEEVKGGIDIYFTSQKNLRSLGPRLKKQFKGELKITKKLFSVNKLTSKRIYRATVLFRLEK
ncbi:hypothetical protein J4459_00200 [Candidatus Woesearchaeota archaeon]|nr:hypothetical protein [Candidatus Woesearchaeota archaeon]